MSNEAIPNEADVLEVTKFDGHPAEVLTTMRGICVPPDEYTITPGSHPESTNVSLIVPVQHNKFLLTPEKALVTRSVVKTCRHIEGSARQHLFTVINARHDEANFLRYIVMSLGGTAKPSQNGLVLRITADVSTIEKINAFIRGISGLSSNVRINPVFESLAARREIDDLVHDPNGREASREMRVVRIIGDSRGAPDIAVLEQLADEQKKVRLDSLSRHTNPPDTHMFEMVAILNGAPEFLDKLQPALVSNNVGIYAADTVPPDRALQYLQAVPEDEWTARDIIGKGLQTRHKRWPDRKPVVTGTVNAELIPRLRNELRERKIPFKINVPIVPDVSPTRGLSARTGKRGPVEGQAEENHEYYRTLMRAMLLELVLSPGDKEKEPPFDSLRSLRTRKKTR